VRFVEVNIYGVYVAPISVMMLVAWLIMVMLRRLAVRFNVLRYVWHPAVFVFSIYIIVLSAIVLIVGASRAAGG
jgi:protein AaeX